VVNNGDFTAEHLPAAAQYVVAGAFMPKHKYPRGGALIIQAGAALTPEQPIPARLNPEAALVLPGGGYFAYAGDTFDEQAFIGSLRPVVIERVRQIRFLGGMSELKVGNGNDVSSSTTLLANDPAEALVRRPGATVMIGGGDITSKQGYEGSLGRNERLDFASGIARHLKGGGGPPGSQNRSIIPWMTIGTLYHPGDGGFATWDAGSGVHTLRKEEYSSTITGPPERNVRCDQLSLGANQHQTVNSLYFGGWGNSDIGAGSTLTITSGALRTGGMGGTTIGKTPGAAGTIDFGAAEGVIWTAWVTPYGDTTIYSTIAGSGGLTKSSTSTLILTAANTYTGTTCIAAGVLQVGDGGTPAARLGDGDVEVANGATLRIAAGTANAVFDTATITLQHAADLFFGTIDLAEGVAETVGALVVDGKALPVGTYGGRDSAAASKIGEYFTGRGILTVTGKTAPPR
jgi:autotransporter-associated beta strand protein